MLKKHDVSSKSSREKKIMASAKKTSFVIQHQLQNDECEELHHMETVNEERLLQDDPLPMQEILNESGTQGENSITDNPIMIVAITQPNRVGTPSSERKPKKCPEYITEKNQLQV